MMPARTLLVGGLSSIHDPLAAATLRGLGQPSVALHARTDAGLRRARAFGNHGQCNPAHYAVGAVLEHARIAGIPPAEFASQYAWLTVGSCGPCRLAAFGLEYERVLGGAGLNALPIVMLEQLSFVGTELPGGLRRLDTSVSRSLLLAVVAGDVIAAVGHRIRPYARDPNAVDALLNAAVQDVAAAFETRTSILPALARLRSAARLIDCDAARALPRILLVGEPWTTLDDGDPSYDLARRLEVFGAEVDVPTAADWIRFRLWEVARDARRELDRRTGTRRLAAIQRADRMVRAAFRLFARTAGLSRDRLVDLDALAAAAASLYDPDVRGGSAHLEIGRAVLAARDRAAHLILSLKPFGCLPSSALSDGIMTIMVRACSGVRFVVVETTGDADAAAESRVEMAVHAAALQAGDEFDAACLRRSLSTSETLVYLDARGLLDVTGPRTYACTAAEAIHRGQTCL